MQFSKAIYDATRERFGLKDSVWVNGEEYAQIPTAPDALLFWAADRIATPIFGPDGGLHDWEVADAATRQKYRIIVEEVARANGYVVEGCGPAFDSDVACRLVVITITNAQVAGDRPDD